MFMKYGESTVNRKQLKQYFVISLHQSLKSLISTQISCSSAAGVHGTSKSWEAMSLVCILVPAPILESKLKLAKSEYLSNKYMLEDMMIKKYPRQITELKTTSICNSLLIDFKRSCISFNSVSFENGFSISAFASAKLFSVSSNCLFTFSAYLGIALIYWYTNNVI